MTFSELRDAFVAALLDWAGVAGVDPRSRGQYVDARHLTFIEAFFGDTYREFVAGREELGFPSTSLNGAQVET
ncbi:hypothetical protein, partial [Acinetobacter baumannii]|uniref:hypothetical protein n=1 Tax=Acinetobacter baumannii TaxID=470 RepID=UPI001C0A2C42